MQIVPAGIEPDHAKNLPWQPALAERVVAEDRVAPDDRLIGGDQRLIGHPSVFRQLAAEQTRCTERKTMIGRSSLARRVGDAGEGDAFLLDQLEVEGGAEEAGTR